MSSCSQRCCSPSTHTLVADSLLLGLRVRRSLDLLVLLLCPLARQVEPRRSASIATPPTPLTQPLAELGRVAAHVVKVHCIAEYASDDRAGGDEGDLACTHDG